MRIIFWGKGERGTRCLEALQNQRADIQLVVCEKQDQLEQLAINCHLPVALPSDPNQADFIKQLKDLKPDLFVLAGYGKILKREVLQVPRVMGLNLHGGKLPQYRGSSPMNWALINGERSFNLSIIRVDAGVDTGDLAMERSFDIASHWTIKDLHTLANEEFPKMLIELLPQIQSGKLQLQKQTENNAAYYPLRFPEDGFVLWDQMSAEQIHNMIRALTDPYPCAFTFYKNQKIQLVQSEMPSIKHFGVPGRVYKIENNRMLVCAIDHGLWITNCRFADSNKSAFDEIKRYESFRTLRHLALESRMEQ